MAQPMPVEPPSAERSPTPPSAERSHAPPSAERSPTPPPGATSHSVPSSTSPSAGPRRLPVGRYGPPADPGRRRRGVAAVWALATGGVALVVWIGLDAANTPVTWTDVGFTLDGTRGVEVVYEVARTDPSVAVRCRLEALNQAYAQVGVLVVDVPASEARTERFASTVATSEPAVTGLVESCWVP